MAELIADRYSTAVFEAGEDLGKIKEFYNEFTFLKEVFQGEEKLVEVLKHPKISKKEKKELMNNIFGENISQELINFLYILIDKNREGYLVDIIEGYEDLYFDYQGILRVVAVTVKPLKDDAKDRLAEALKAKLNKEIIITNEIDEDIIGGVKLEIEGKLIDGTIQGKLESISKMFKAATN